MFIDTQGGSKLPERPENPLNGARLRSKTGTPSRKTMAGKGGVRTPVKLNRSRRKASVHVMD